MVTIKLITKINSNYGHDSIIEIDGKQMTIEEYNEPSNFKKSSELIPVGEYFTELTAPEIQSAKYYAGIDNDFINKELQARKLYAELNGSLQNKDGTYPDDKINLEEMKKNEQVNRNLYADIDRKRKELNELHDQKGFLSLHISKFENNNTEKAKEVVEFNNEKWSKLLPVWKELINLQLLLKKQKDETGQTPGKNYVPPQQHDNIEDRNREEKEKEELRNSSKQKIQNALSQEPQVSSSELSYSNWENLLWHANSKKGIDDLREQVLTDIAAKRSAKNGEVPKGDDKLAIFKRDAIGEIDVKKNAAGLLNESDLDTVNHGWRQAILEADSENKINLIKARVLADIRNRESKKSQDKDQAKHSAERIKQATLEEIDNMKDDQLKEAMELFTRWEGEDDFAKVETASQIEERLMREHPDVYRETIIDALMQRMSDYGITSKDLDEESQQILRGNITDVNKFKQIKDETIKAIGTKGAKSQWEALTSQAQALLKKAKNAVTQQVEKDIKTIQAQIKNFKTKAGSNSYLSSIYNSNKTTMERMESDLNSCLNNQNTGSPKETPWGIIIPVSLVTVVAVVAAVIVIRRRRQAKIVE